MNPPNHSPYLSSTVWDCFHPLHIFSLAPVAPAPHGRAKVAYPHFCEDNKLRPQSQYAQSCLHARPGGAPASRVVEPVTACRRGKRGGVALSRRSRPRAAIRGGVRAILPIFRLHRFRRCCAPPRTSKHRGTAAILASRRRYRFTRRPVKGTTGIGHHELSRADFPPRLSFW